jgi:LemA protein
MRLLSKNIVGTVLLLLVAFGLSGCGVNQAPTLDEKCKAAWAEVQNQYQRRADLIPNLVETVKGYATHEKSTLVEVTQARAAATQPQLQGDITQNPQAFQQSEQAQAQLGSALSRLMVVVEKYPDLKADDDFMALQSQLEGTENRIAVARRDYIATVQQYNILLRTIPSKWIAHLLYPDLKPREEFTATPDAQAAPQVKF